MQGHLQAEPRDNWFFGLLNRDALARNTPQGIKGGERILFLGLPL